jgi:hypothetical protein
VRHTSFFIPFSLFYPTSNLLFILLLVSRCKATSSCFILFKMLQSFDHTIASGSHTSFDRKKPATEKRVAVSERKTYPRRLASMCGQGRSRGRCHSMVEERAITSDFTTTKASRKKSTPLCLSHHIYELG